MKLCEGGVGEDIIHAVCSHGYGIIVGCGVTIGSNDFPRSVKLYSTFGGICGYSFYLPTDPLPILLMWN